MPKTKGATRVTESEIRRFRKLLDDGLSIARAAEKIGRSKDWGYDFVTKERQREAQRESAMPAPKQLDELDGAVKDSLKDFSLFEVAFLARRPAAWRKHAADRIVEFLVNFGHDYDPENPPPRTYVDINTPPGVGKTTLLSHDIPLWLICGGGVEDPEVGRAIRILLGSEGKHVAEHYVLRLRRTLESIRPYSYYDKSRQQRFTAELSIVAEFGRFKPERSLGEPTVWKANEFTVVQLTGVDLAEKEPTCQAASQESGFVGERVDFYNWDDLSTRRNSMKPEPANEVAEFFRDEAEPRLEPGGVGCLTGQRFGPMDLHRKSLDSTYVDDDGIEQKKYKHIIYPAHFEHLCDADKEGGKHRQWDGANDGCLLDAWRLPWRDIQMKMSDPNFRTVYQQEDSDPATRLVQPQWIDGVADSTGYVGPGCYDSDRGFFEHPSAPTIDYCMVDPSVANWWVFEWWALDPETMNRYLIWGTRRKMQAGGDEGFLDWDNRNQCHVGLLEEIQKRSGDLGRPIRLWIVEANAAHKYLFQHNHFNSWRVKWAMVDVIAHSTQRNKADENYGITGTLKLPYKQGKKRLPRKHGDLEALNFVRQHVHELTRWPQASTDDCVLTDWFGEHHIDKVLEYKDGGTLEAEYPDDLPQYLKDQQIEVAVN